MAKFKFDLTSKRTWKKILAVGLAVLASAASIFGVVKLAENLKDETKKISPSWEIGVISTTTGKADREQKTSIYTEESFEAKGLEVILDFDHNVTYQVFWYDSVGEFAYASEEMDKGAAFYAPYNHKARIEITPKFTDEDKDEEISWYETSKYSKQVEIRIDKEQELKAKDFTDVKLSNTSYFRAEAGSVTFSGSEVIFTENSNTTYIYENTNGRFSAFYLKKISVASSADAVLVRLKNGTTISYFGERYPSRELFNDNKPLPTNANEAISLPEGATLYIVSVFDVSGEVNNAAETIVAFY